MRNFFISARSWLSLFPVLTLLALSSPAAEFIVAPTGLPSGDGSLGNPWDLQTALYHPAALRPGDTLRLRGGTYRAPRTPDLGRTYFATLNGTAAQPILIKPYPSEAPVVDGGILCRAGSGWHQFWGFRITNTDTNRLITANANARGSGLFLEGKGVKVINMVIDNAATPIFWGDSGLSAGDGGEIYGCIIYGGGVYDTRFPGYSPDNPWTRGNGIYSQNRYGQRAMRDNICFRNFTGGLMIYAEGGYANGMTMEGNVSFDPAGGAAFEGTSKDHPMESITMLNNFAFSEKPGNLFWVGYQSQNNQRATIVGNYGASLGSWTTGLISVKNFDSATIRSNTFYCWGSNKSIASIDRAGGLSSFPFDWDYNHYYSINPTAFITNNTVPQKTFADWKNITGYDAHSTFANAAPTGLLQFTRRNKYDPARAHLVVYNWSQTPALDYNLAQAGVGVGARFEIRDVQNYFGAPVLSGVYGGGTVSIPLVLTNVSPIVGGLIHFQNKHTPPHFNTFVIIGSPATNSPPPVNTAPTISAIADQTISQGVASAALAFTVADAEGPASALSVSVQSSNPGLIAGGNIQLGGTDTSRSITLAPAANQTGAALITLTVTDGSLSASTSFTIQVNAAPSVNAGPDLVATLPNGITLRGAVIDDGVPNPPRSITTTWSKVSGPGDITFGDVMLKETTATFSEVGVYVLRLMANDSISSASDELTVTIYSADQVNSPPQVNAGNDQTVMLPGGVTLMGAANDDGLPAGSLAIAWSLGGGPGTVTFGNERALSTSATFSVPGNYTIRLQVSDGALAAEDTVTITVEPPTNAPPVVRAGNDATVTWPKALTLVGKVTDDGLPGNTPLVATWSKISGPGNVSFAAHDSPQTTANFSDPGTYVLRLIGSDGELAASDDLTVVVRNAVAKRHFQIEAESGQRIPTMRVAAAADASQGQYVYSPSSEQGSVQFQLQIDEQDDYVIWCRVLAAGPSQDSFFVSLDGGAEDVYDVAENSWSNEWQWSHVTGRGGTGRAASLNPRLFEFNGSHALRFRTRDPNTKLDRLHITNDPDFVPADEPELSNTAPTISRIANQSTTVGQAIAGIAFVIGDKETASESLSVTTRSSNQGVVPDGNIELSGAAASRTLGITPTTKIGSATISITVSDGELTQTTSFSVLVRKSGDLGTGTMTVQINGVGRVSPNPNGYQLKLGKTYTIVAQPGAGQVFAGWSGSTNSSAPRLVFQMQPDLVFLANFVPTPFIPFKGGYNGLFYDTNEVRHESSGVFSALVTDKGSFSAKLRIGNKMYPFTGQFDVQGRASKVLLLSPTNSLNVELRLLMNDGDDQIVGTVSGDAWSAELLADRVISQAIGQSHPSSGKYTLAIPGGLGPETGPAGDGFGSVNVDTRGRLRLVGDLADGTKISQSTPVSRHGLWPLYVPLYAGRGSVVSWVTFTNLPAESMTGLLCWIRPHQPRAKSYSAGFTNETQLYGSHYHPLASPARLGLSSSNAMLVLGEAHSGEILTNYVTLPSIRPITTADGSRIAFRFIPALGTFSGELLDAPAHRKFTFRGAVMQEQDLGTGYCLSTNQPGFVRLEPLPDAY